MAPIFSVGNPESLMPILQSIALRGAAKALLNYEFSEAEGVTYSEDLDYDGWTTFRSNVVSDLGEDRAPCILALPEDSFVLLPFEFKAAAALTYFDSRPPIIAGSLPFVLKEVQQFAKLRDLPTVNDTLCEYFSRDVYEDDEGVEIPTYCQFMLCALIAEQRSVPLWYSGG